MKIHVVQSGDTLFNIAQKYNVELDTIKNFNKHLANPENIMPGLKIKIPTTSKPIKMEQRNEAQQPIQQQMKQPTKVEHPFKDMSPKMKPVVKEDEIIPEKKMMPYNEAVMPSIPKMPNMELDVDLDVEESTDYYNVNQYYVTAPPKQYPKVPYQPSGHHGYMNAPTYKKPCGCGGHQTYYMPVYPMQNPYYGMYPQYPMYEPNTAQPIQGMEQYNQGQYPQMNLDIDDESSSFDLPKIPQQFGSGQEQGYGNFNTHAAYPNWNNPQMMQPDQTYAGWYNPAYYGSPYNPGQFYPNPMQSRYFPTDGTEDGENSE